VSKGPDRLHPSAREARYGGPRLFSKKFRKEKSANFALETRSANLAFPARAQQVIERLSLDGLVRHAPSAEACCHRAVRTPERGCVRVVD
jgi:hypothetical protein